jgi:hypothetical protein
MYSRGWSDLSKLYSSQARARTMNMRIALAMTRQNQLSITKYYSKMRSLADDMASTALLLEMTILCHISLQDLMKIIMLL